MTEDEVFGSMETTTDHLIQNLTNEQDGEIFTAAYLKADFLSSAVNELFYARRSAHITQDQLAQKLGKKQSAIARWETDTEGKMSLRQYVEIALACGVIPLPMRLEPVFSVRDYIMENPRQPLTHLLYEAWQARKLQLQLLAQSILEPPDATIQAHAISVQTNTSMPREQRTGLLAKDSPERFLTLASTASQQSIIPNNLITMNQASRSGRPAQSGA